MNLSSKKCSGRRSDSLVSVGTGTEHNIQDVVIHLNSKSPKLFSPVNSGGFKQTHKFKKTRSNMENTNPHNFRENAIKSRPNFKNSAKLTQQIRVEVIAFIINANLITACFTLLFRARIIIIRWKNKQKIRPFSSNGKIKNMCFVSLQQKLQMNKKSKDLKSKSVDEFSKRIIKPRPRTARLFRNRENENTVRIQENIELDIDGCENMFNVSVEQPKRKYSKVSNKLRKSIDVEKIINNLNYFPNKPTILCANPVTREDPSWGNLRQKENGIMDMTEVKGYYEHLTLFLEDTIIQRRETPCTSLTPYINTEKETDKPVMFRDVGFNTLNYSSNTYSLENYHNELRMNKVELGHGLKCPTALK